MKSRPESGSVERYRPLIDDWEGFVEAVERPPVASVRENPLKSGEGFEDDLGERFEGVEQADWNPRIYRLGREE
ncbi:MAG: hypothetical protein ABEI07_01255, partial [Candidatus Nanohaloarchaea archaeon]